jgi:branched-subunit amino acid transport protein
MTAGPGELWLLIAGCIAMTAAFKAFGPVVVGGRDLPDAFIRVVALMAPALLAALVVTAALASGARLGVGAHTAGVAVGAVLLWRGRSLVLAAGVAMAVTALIRALS